MYMQVVETVQVCKIQTYWMERVSSIRYKFAYAHKIQISLRIRSLITVFIVRVTLDATNRASDRLRSASAVQSIYRTQNKLQQKFFLRM